ncbi:SRPBCC family protein [Robertkochia aurantiaca]|uniref:SRPBCC family protein n=1 Tax=Robertkochia aurantiaca TaxID=2873700 RepID=UPI001CCC8754|nr:SRPBCC family protein [Robertkochia sp. 3YJGBD-33]
MKILKYILILIAIILIGFALYVALEPDHYKVTRSQTIQAPPSVIDNYITDYRKWTQWSPWESQDPNAAIEYGDPASGPEGSYSWNGEVLGKGSMKTLFISPDSILQEIKFIEPYESRADVFWTLDSVAEGTEVTWGMEGDLSFTERAFMVFQGDMNTLIGPDYERGLNNLDSLVTADMQAYSIEIIGETTYGGGYYMYKTAGSSTQQVDEVAAPLFEDVEAYMENNNISSSGNPFLLIEKWDEENMSAIISASIPVTDRVITTPGSEILCGFQESGMYFKSRLTGHYDNLEEAWTKTEEALKAAGYMIDPGAKPFEVYLNDSDQLPNPAEWKTEIYVPVKKAPDAGMEDQT